MKKLDTLASGAVALLLPMITLAASDIGGALESIKSILITVIGVLFVLVTLYFIWGVVQYVGASGDDTKIKAGKEHMIWGIIGMAVMAGAWGIVTIITKTFGVGNTTIPGGTGQLP